MGTNWLNTLVRIDNIKWESDCGDDGSELPDVVLCGIRELVSEYDGNPNRVFDIDKEVRGYLEYRYDCCVEGFDVPEELRELGKPCGLHFVKYVWRDYKEDEEVYAFPTMEAAKDFVRRQISERKRRFDEGNPTYPRTDIKLDEVCERLFYEGETRDGDCVYCQTPCWHERWEYWEMADYAVEIRRSF